jgi:uncharacterized protein YcfL
MTLLRLATLALLAALVAGCSASNQATHAPDDDGNYQTVLKSNNSMLQSRISINELKKRRVGDLLQVQATLENQWKFELDFQYKFKWFDKDGFEINPEGQPWQQLVMGGRTQANVQGVAPNPTAKSFEIWVRE